MRPIPILLYHSIGEARDERYRRWVVKPELFARHLRYLSSAGFQSLTVSDLARLRACGLPIPERPVVLTFDDGLQDFLVGALPMLMKYGLTATLYVVSGCIGGTSRWLAALGEGTRPMLSADELQRVARCGIEIGAHTVNHPQLDVLPTRLAASEISMSRRSLEEVIGQPVRSFAYPHGYNSRVTRKLVRDAGFESACRVRHALSSTLEDPFALSRIVITEEVDETELDRLLFAQCLPVAPPVDYPAATGWRLARRVRGLLESPRVGL